MYVHIQRLRHKSKHNICCFAVIQHFLRSLLSAIYCTFNCNSGQKGDLPGIFHCAFATQFPLKLSAGFCCKMMLILQETKTCADISRSCVSGMIKDQSQWYDCMVLAWDLGNEYSSLCNWILLIRGNVRWPKTQSCSSSAPWTSKVISRQLSSLTLKAVMNT